MFIVELFSTIIFSRKNICSYNISIHILVIIYIVKLFEAVDEAIFYHFPLFILLYVNIANGFFSSDK